MKKRLKICFLILITMSSLCACATDDASTTTSGSQAEAYTGNGSEWCSSLFELPSGQYNSQLALVAAEMSEKAENNIDNKESIRELYTDYGLYACEYQNFGRVNADKVDFVFSDSAAFAIGQSTLNINGIDTTILVITARGTKNLWESLGDWGKGGEANFLGTYIWQNAYDFEEKIWTGIDEYISKYPTIKKTNDLKILVTGHSLGGAAANLIGARFTNGADGDSWWADKISQDDIYVYTYGAIKVLTREKNISKGYENIHNLFNYYDSFGPEGNFSIFNASSFNAKFGHTDLYRDEADRNAAASGSTSFDNHLMENYKRAVKNGIVVCTAYEEQYTSDNKIEIPKSSKSDNTEHDRLETAEFTIEGKWKNIGNHGFGQAHPGAIITFNKTHCNYYSIRDTYALYEENGNIKLDCTSYILAETLSFTVEIIDKNNIIIYYGSKGVQLKRVENT